MELFSFYNLSVSLFIAITNEVKISFTWGAAVGGLIWLAFFLLQGVGLYTMAKRRGMKKKGLAFVPFANIFYMGKIVGDCAFFGHKMKNAGIYAMIAQILSVVVTLLYISCECYLYVMHGAPLSSDTNLLALPQWDTLTGFSEVAYTIYEYSGAVYYIVGLISQIMLIILTLGLYQKYSPRNYRILTVLAFMFAPARFIIAFVLRNRPPVDFEEYRRRQYEAYMRRQQQYYNQYGNPYNNPYGRPPYGGNPYGNGYGNNGQNQNDTPAEEPFEEFSSNVGNAPVGEDGKPKDEVDEFFS